MTALPWIGDDDAQPGVKKLDMIKKPADKPGLNVALEPQRIRTFEISYAGAAVDLSKAVGPKKPNLKLKAKPALVNKSAVDLTEATTTDQEVAAE